MSNSNNINNNIPENENQSNQRNNYESESKGLVQEDSIQSLTKIATDLLKTAQQDRISNDNRLTSIEQQMLYLGSRIENGLNKLRNVTPSSSTIPNNINGAGIISFGESPIHNNDYDNENEELDPPPQSYNVKQQPSKVTTLSSSASRFHKFKQPESFLGKPGTNPNILLSFIAKMDLFIQAYDLAEDSRESLKHSVMSLGESALLWYTNIAARDPKRINSWKDLRDELKRHFRNKAEEQLTHGKLMRLRLQGSVQTYNDIFLQHLQLIPEFNTPENDQTIMIIYANGITESSCDNYIATMVRSALASGKMKTVIDLMGEALLAEYQVGKKPNSNNYRKTTIHSTSTDWRVKYNNNNSNSNKTPYRPINSNNNYNSNRFSGNSNNNNRSFSSPFRSNNFSRFQTPTSNNRSTGSVNNVETTGDAFDDCENNDNHENEHGETDNINECVQEQIDEYIENELDEAMLFAMNNLVKYSKANPDKPLSPEEVQRRMRNKTCFKCNQTGHFADKCPKN